MPSEKDARETEQSTPSSEFRGTERFEVRERLGSGGMGIVYRAFDVERQNEVALKLLRRADPQDLLRFKREFRALADVSHPNLVTLYELLSVGDQWFFTMELIDGVDFLAHVRGAEQGEAARDLSWQQEVGSAEAENTTEALQGQTVETVELETSTLRSGSGERRRSARPPATAPDQISRLREAAAQLGRGVAALHRAGHLHRDLKPSNVMVTRAGRVVILDFGVIGDVAGRQEADGEEEELVVGTPAYMAPEQAAAAGASRASDWYTVGVMIYEALTGQRPIDGPSDVVLEWKRQWARLPEQELPIPPARELAPDAPSDLDGLCAALLRTEAARRPEEAEVLAVLGDRDEEGEVAATSGRVALQGRGNHLAALSQAYDTTSRAEPCVVLVHGRSGMGKTALVSAFLSRVRAETRALVLEGRCYESESVPYKALDSLVDALCRHLLKLREDEVAGLLPPDVAALARLFPVLRRVSAQAEAAQSSTLDGLDAFEVRRRAFGAFRELFRNLTRRGPVVLFIDDLQWGEIDSAELLEALMREPGAPPVLLIAAYRREDAATALIQRMLERTWRSAEVIAVDPLDDNAARGLAEALLRDSGADASSLAVSIAGESQGSPFFIQELAHFAAQHAETTSSFSAGSAIELDELLRSRVGELPAAPRRLLEVVAVAGRPTTQKLISMATDLRGDEQAALTLLRSGKLVRTRGVRATDEIECFHDRIREAVLGGLDADRKRECHQQLARVFEASGEVDPETLSLHFEGAGKLQRAAALSVAAAERAVESLAFDRAAALYARALDLDPPEDSEAEVVLREPLADALAHARRGPEAAEEYLRAADLRTDRAASLALRRRAAEELMRSGHIDAGLAALNDVLHAYDMKLPSSPRRALASLLLRRARVRLRGTRFRAREPSQVAPAQLERIDLCWSTATAQAMLDNIAGADFQARSLLLALEAGEPMRVLRSVAMEACFSSMVGGPGRPRFERLMRRARPIAAELKDPYIDSLLVGIAGVAAFLRGDWTDALALVIEAETMLRAHVPGASWELDITRLYRCWSLVLRGDFADARPRIADSVREAEDRGDLFAATNLRTTLSNLVWLAADDLDKAREQAQAALLQWSQAGFFVQHYYDLLARGNIDLYAGEGGRAYERIDDAWPAVKKSLLLRLQYIRVTLLDTRARGAIAGAQAASDGETQRRLLRDAERSARKIAREKMRWTVPLAEMITGCVAAVRGEEERCLATLERAVENFERADMGAHAAAARRRVGQLRGGEEGRALVASADAWMRAQAIENPARFASMLAPGCADG